MGQYATYILRDPETRSIRYIGKTKQRLAERLARHIRDAQERNRASWADRTHRANWIRKLLAGGMKPELVEIHRYESLEEVNEAEKFLIRHFRVARSDLTNATDGGDGCVTPRKPAVSDAVVLTAYLGGASSVQIANEFKTCKKRVLGLVRAAGMLRSAGRRKKS